MLVHIVSSHVVIHVDFMFIPSRWLRPPQLGPGNNVTDLGTAGTGLHQGYLQEASER